jgi:hypothetical protein
MMRLNARTLLLIGAAAALAACNKQAAPANESAKATANETAAASTAAPVANDTAPVTPAAATVGGAPTADYMVGKWSAMGEDCKDTLEFKKDGTVLTPIGPGKWDLVGDKLSFEYGGERQSPSTIKVLSPTKIEITRSSGGKETEIRC